MGNFRVRFAPSPTGALHIGGIRTALYNYLLAKKQGGTFILRIEDTDQNRFVPGAEEYIIESLRWCGLIPDEGPGFGGQYGPYRQSERKELYRQYADQLIESGNAYLAFDTPEELEARREAAQGNFKYDSHTRDSMRNSLTLSPAEVKAIVDSGEPYVVRLKVPATGVVQVNDRIRGEVVFECAELDDKVILKSDGMPTYHLANIVDDRLMKITHVIRGEEWLPSTAHHVLLYRFLGWEPEMPEFAHLPLILKPNGKGKLSKRDGAKLGIPVFPLSWKGETPEESFIGFREFGFDAHAAVNFLAMLGWNPGTEQEIFSIDQLAEAFSIEKIGKAGARFDFDKARWFNQQYIMATPDEELAARVRPFLGEAAQSFNDTFLAVFCRLMKERVSLYTEFWEKGDYFFRDVQVYDEEGLQKRWRPELRPSFEELAGRLRNLPSYEPSELEAAVKQFLKDRNLKFGDVLPLLRIALAGTMHGPAIYETMSLLGQAEVDRRLVLAFNHFDRVVALPPA